MDYYKKRHRFVRRYIKNNLKEHEREEKSETESRGMMFISSILSLLLVLGLVKLFYKLCWSPIRIRYLMGLQGIRGPSYRLIHGSTKEIRRMKEEAMSKPMELSNAIFPKVHPHIHSWTKIYGK